MNVILSYLIISKILDLRDKVLTYFETNLMDYSKRIVMVFLNQKRDFSITLHPVKNYFKKLY